MRRDRPKPKAGSSRSRWVVLKEAAIRKSRPGEKREVDLEDVVQLLRWEVRRVGSQMAFARIAGADRATVNKTLHAIIAIPKGHSSAQSLYGLHTPNSEYPHVHQSMESERTLFPIRPRGRADNPPSRPCEFCRVWRIYNTSCE
jgi:hypothetical protein